MALNPYFSKYQTSESTLVDDLVVETIKIHGHEMVYLVRESPEIDLIFGEDAVPSIYRIGIPIEMYIESVDGFEGEGDFISKFGLEVRDTMKVVVSKTRWKHETSSIEAEITGEGPTSLVRPREGDLLYFPLSKGIFEIKFVEHENPFYQFGKNYVYKLSCELATHAGDTYSTEDSTIDTIGNSPNILDFAVDITMSTGTGTFTVGETVSQGTATAKVLLWTPPTLTSLGVLRVERVVGTFAVSATPIVGAESLASWIYSSKLVTDIGVGPPNDTVTQNPEFDIELSRIVDFTESNPFSEEV